MPAIETAKTPEQLEATLRDDAQLAELLKNPENFGEFIRDYVSVQNRGDHIGKQVREHVTQAVGDMLRDSGTETHGKGGEFDDATNEQVASLVKNELGAQLTEMAKAGKLDGADVQRPEMASVDQKSTAWMDLAKGKGAAYSRSAPGVHLDGIKDLGPVEMFRATWHQKQVLANPERYSAFENEIRRIQNSFGTTIPADGGLLVPETMRSQIMQLALESAVVRPRATVIPMSGGRLKLPAVDDTSHVSSVLGGMQAFWADEAEEIQETQAKFRALVLDPKKLTALAVAPNELIADVTAFESWLGQALPQTIAYFEDVAFIDGDGVERPYGFKNAGVTVSQAAEGGQTSGIQWENIVKMYARMLPNSLGRAVWVVNQETFPSLATMALNVGTGGSAIWLNNGVEGPPARILGRPVIVSEKMEALSTSGDIMFCDFGYYVIGDRQTIQISSSTHARHSTDETEWRVIERVDGRTTLRTPLTPRKGSNTLSPFVKLDTRS